MNGAGVGRLSPPSGCSEARRGGHTLPRGPTWGAKSGMTTDVSCPQLNYSDRSSRELWEGCEKWGKVCVCGVCLCLCARREMFLYVCISVCVFMCAGVGAPDVGFCAIAAHFLCLQVTG